ncbi:hypothetical protein P7228_02715 [Altererythrobacter arenosus]|uniref:Cell division protein FtsL n=1 Tax=Altererythrobacter arenosus TaxID=3032592 RepID=A0ABY8FSK6_9SPHN|nr:hypothetical protein [Altererythrobacter sp. CAU 1644]WFL77997.1 hypothetical protein P7228_02715 [Altererythrobacter sp. CAU 1644]
MNISGSRLRQIGWAAALLACFGLFLGLSFRVHAVKSEVLLAEREIIELKRETVELETEFQARASQRQLADWNAVEFGYEAPRADQYLESERQLASLGSPRGPGAPSPIRVARADFNPDAGERPQMVSPVTGKPVELAMVQQASVGSDFAGAFADILSEAAPVGTAQARTLLSAEARE